MRQGQASAVRQALRLALLFFAAAAAGVWLSRESGNIAAFWPPNAILLGVLLRSPRQDVTLPVAACAVANLVLNLLLGDQLSVATGFACGNMLEVVCAYRLIASFAGLPMPLTSLRQLVVFLLGAVILAPTLGATVGAALVSHYFAAPFWTVWQTWGTADAVGMILFAPLIAAWDGGRQLRELLTGPRLGVAAGELAVAVALLAGGLVLTIRTGQHSLAVLFEPILLWLALRFGIGLTTAAAATVCLTAVVATMQGVWPLPVTISESAAARIVPLQLFIAATVLPALLVAVTAAERERMAAELRRAKRWLDDGMESMADGLALFDAEERLVYCNQHYLACFPNTAGLRVPGARMSELRAAAIRKGEFKGVDASNGEAWAARQAEIYASGGQAEYELADGRHMLSSVRRTASGGTVVVWHDITELRRAQEALEHAASHDALTGLPNGATFRRELERACARAERGRHQLAVMLIDLDRFKEVNDGLGHAVGDMLLVEVGARLRAALREGDLAARLGGDEFAVLAEGRDDATFGTLAARLVERLGTPARFDAIAVRLGASLGYTVFPHDTAGPSELLIHADRALYAAKDAGRGTWAVYGAERHGPRSGAAPHEDEMAAALERGEFELHYQPIVALESFEVLGVEALLRWRHPTRGLLPAGAFIGTAERRPLILELTRHVLAQGLRQQRAWVAAGTADLRLWVNLAPRCLAWDGLVDAVAGELAATTVPPERLVLEITEGAFANREAAERQVRSLRRLGLGVAIDDFGAGYSSLARLRSLPMDAVKIDRAFVAEVTNAACDRAIVRTIVALGGNLGLTPLAEGIETGEQLQVLRRLGCVWGQGYLFAKPMPPEEVAAWLATWSERRRLAPGYDLLRRRKGTE